MSGDYPQMNKLLDSYVNKRATNAYPAGINDDDKGYLKYAPSSSIYPTLLIVDPIYDNEQNIITPGYYTLILSYDRKTLVLTERGKTIATFPVFKMEEDKSRLAKQQPMTKQELRKQQKEQKKKDKINKQRIKKGEEPLKEDIYSNASIEYCDEGQYYLIKYEKEHIRAWGAIKD